MGKWLVSSPIELAAREPEAPEPTHVALVNYRGSHTATVSYDSSLNDDGSVTSNVYTNSEEGGDFGTSGFGASFAVWCWSGRDLGILLDGFAPQDGESLPVTLTIDGEAGETADWEIGNHYRDDVVTHSWLEAPDARALFDRLQTATRLSAQVDGIDGTHTWDLSDTFSTPIQGNLAECGNYVEGQVQEPPPPSYVPVTNVGGWSGQIQYGAWTNADDGTVSTRLVSLPHANDESGLGTQLVVACWSGQHPALQIEGLPTLDSNSVQVTLRIDGAEPITETWNVWNGLEDNNADSNVHTSWSQLTDPQFRTASSVTVEIGSTDPIVVTFDIDGMFETPLQENLDECGNYVEGETRTIEYDYVPWTGAERVSASLQYRANVAGDGVSTDIFNDVPTPGAVDGRLRFHVSCWSEGTSLNMQVLGFPMGEQRPVEVTITFADGSTHVSHWRVSDWQGNGVQTALPPNLLARFVESSTVTFAIEGVEFSPMTFDLTGMFETPVQENIVNCGMNKRGESREVDLPESPVVSGRSDGSDGETTNSWSQTPSGGPIPSISTYQYIHDGELQTYIIAWCGPHGTTFMVRGARFGDLSGDEVEVVWSLDGGPEQRETWSVTAAYGSRWAHPDSAIALLSAWRNGMSVDLTLQTAPDYMHRINLSELFGSPVQAGFDECLARPQPTLPTPAGTVTETTDGQVTYNSGSALGSDVAATAMWLNVASESAPAWAGYSSRIAINCGIGGRTAVIYGVGLDRPVFIRGYSVDVTWSVDGDSESTSTWSVWPWSGDSYALSPPDDAAFYAAIKDADSLTITVASDPEFVETYDFAGNSFWTTPVQPNLDACVGS